MPSHFARRAIRKVDVDEHVARDAGSEHLADDVGRELDCGVPMRLASLRER